MSATAINNLMGGFLNFKDVQKLTGLSRATIYRQINAGTFPKPRQLTHSRVGFLASELEGWMTTRVGVPWGAAQNEN
ncbi:MAG: AlpA family phage regulatory protein [bacterium]|nr:AlpA family phage regulatory protein [bacterium]